MGIDLRPMLCRSVDEAQRNARLGYSKEWEQRDQTIDDDSWILLPISPTERQIYGDCGSYKEPILFLLADYHYHKDFLAMLEMIKEYGGAGSMTHFPNMLKQELETNGTDLSKATSEQLKDGKKTVHGKFLAALMLSRANGAKYNDLK
jgi:hypothetical protein